MAEDVYASKCVRNLAEQGAGVPVDPDYPIKRYFNSGEQMLRMAKVYVTDGDLEKAFVIYTRYITIFLEKIRDHPEFAVADPRLKLGVRETCKKVLPIAENLKEQLKLKFKNEYLLKMQQEEKEKLIKAKEVPEKPKVQPSDQEEKSIEERLKERIQSKLTEIDRERKDFYQEETPIPPAINNNASTSQYTSSSIPSSIPKVDRRTKPHPSSLLTVSNGEGLQKVIIPASLASRFLDIAKPNTLNDIETCGILAGKFSDQRFTITHLLIPSQLGTSNSCLTENEERIFCYQNKEELITLGWIHTHPSQTAFMSSIDLHTHYSYQIMLPEAIAIVCAPRFETVCVFSLTFSGLDLIANCREDGFHPHSSSFPISEESSHVVFDSTKDVKIVDLRN